MILKNVRINGEKKDIQIENGRIVTIASSIKEEGIDTNGLTLLPAFCDMHVHLREPGGEGKEDIQTASQAAAGGGYFAVTAMPNTDPVCDNAVVVNYLLQRAQEVGLVKILPIGAITKNLDSAALTDMMKMKQAGAVAFSNDGLPVFSSQTMRLALEYAKSADTLIISHSEDKELSAAGVIHEGEVSARLGLSGIPRAAEEVAVAREILIAECVDARVHIAHISTSGSVDLVRQAKRRGVKVTAETAPHYFSGTDELADGFNAYAKVNPPLRPQKDVDAIIEGIKDGTIDVIATDHAPHRESDKEILQTAAFGISGLDTAFSLCYTNLVKAGHITLDYLVKMMSTRPCELLGLKAPQIKEGEEACFTLVDLDANYAIDRTKFLSKGKNTPFDKQTVFGKVVATYYQGKFTYRSCGL